MKRDQLLGYSKYGHGPQKVLVFHDWMGSAENYAAVLDYLDEEVFTYVFADLRGYGKSRHLSGDFTSSEAAADALRLADHLGWTRFNAVGHSMTGMVVQRMLLNDGKGDAQRIERAVAITPVSADGYPADQATREFLWDVIGNAELSQMAFGLLTGQRLLPRWGRRKTDRHLASADLQAVKAYFRMWLQEDFSVEVAKAGIATPLRVIGGRQDLPGFQEKHLRATFGQWFKNVDFHFITDAGHYPMQETPIYLATLLEGFLVPK